MPSTIPSYDFLSPAQIVFGWGRWREIGPLAARAGRRAFLVLGSRTLAAGGMSGQLSEVLAQHNLVTVELATVTDEPTVEDVDRLTSQLRAHDVQSGDMLLACGGGSAIDMAKALAAMATNTAGATVRDYLEGVGRGLTLTSAPLPVLAMPTTAGTGSEATKNAVISCHAPNVKKSLRHDALMPRAVVIDPQLAVSLPPAVTAHTGMDAITQLIESYISRKARPIPRALAIGALPGALESITAAVENGQDRDARETMAHAALLSGMALANSGLGMAHGVAAALGVHCGVRHGLACAVMLPVALRTNREVSEPSLADLARAAGLSGGGDDRAAAEKLIERIEQICRQIGIPARLSELGVRREQLPELVRDSRGNSMDGNPRTLADEELTQILAAAL